jgi:hypothetical protein
VYDKWVDQLFSKLDPSRFTHAEQIAEVVYEEAKDGRDQLRKYNAYQ